MGCSERVWHVSSNPQRVNGPGPHSSSLLATLYLRSDYGTPHKYHLLYGLYSLPAYLCCWLTYKRQALHGLHIRMKEKRNHHALSFPASSLGKLGFQFFCSFASVCSDIHIPGFALGPLGHLSSRPDLPAERRLTLGNGAQATECQAGFGPTPPGVAEDPRASLSWPATLPAGASHTQRVPSGLATPS